MNSCQEINLEDLTQIVAVPLENIPASDPQSAANSLSPTIREQDFQYPLTGAVTIGARAAVSGGELIPIKRDTGKAKDSGSDAVSGRLHTVTVTAEADDRDGSTWAPLLQLERGAYHLLLTFRGGQRAFVSATRDTYLCQTERDSGKTTVTFRIYNIMGMQLLV